MVCNWSLANFVACELRMGEWNVIIVGAGSMKDPRSKPKPTHPYILLMPDDIEIVESPKADGTFF